jgi:hypothetical protein
MTTARAMPRNEMCTQHRQPRSECEPWDKHGHTVRFREDDWLGSEALAKAEKSDITTLLAEALEVFSGGLRCPRCNLDADPVPLEYGDLAGRALREWVVDAKSRVRRQHPRHEPVWLGAEPSAPAPMVFMPPMPAAVPDHGGKKGRVKA